MGTRGYRVYRHKGRYFVRYNQFDSYPEGLGLEVLAKVPRGCSPEVFKQWLTAERERFDKVLEDDKQQQYSIQDTAPLNDIFIEWIYEIDLDRVTFHVDSRPLFRLDNCPPPDVFVESIGLDHYGHRAYDISTPEEYRYDWSSSPPEVENISLHSYTTFQNNSSSASIYELLGQPESLTEMEHVRVSLLQCLVAGYIMPSANLRLFHGLQTVPDRNYIPQDTLDLAISIAHTALGPQVIPLRDVPSDGNLELVWVRRDVCVRISTHLDDERNLQAAISHIVDEVNKQIHDKNGVVYGIAFSIFHCSIVRIDLDANGAFQHTPALPFLPSFYASSPETPGITAMARLGCRRDPDVLEKTWRAIHGRTSKCPISEAGWDVFGSKLPLELWEQVAQNIHWPEDLVRFGGLSKQTGTAATELLRYPIVGESRLMSVSKVDLHSAWFIVAGSKVPPHPILRLRVATYFYDDKNKYQEHGFPTFQAKNEIGSKHAKIGYRFEAFEN